MDVNAMNFGGKVDNKKLQKIMFWILLKIRKLFNNITLQYDKSKDKI